MSDLIVAGLRIGSLVRVKGLTAAQNEEFGSDLNGQLGQVLQYRASSDKFQVCLSTGATCFLGPDNVEAASDLRKPGEGGEQESFDVLLGPATSDATLAEEMSLCLMEKGFCVIKLLSSDELMNETLDRLKEMGYDGKLNRLAEEVEEGYLGTGCRGKVTWLDNNLSGDGVLSRSDKTMSYIAELIQPYSFDVLGDVIEERAPALVCMSLLDDEEPEYPAPEADDLMLGDFLKRWRRDRLRIVHFVGPKSAEITLESKDNPAAEALPKGQPGIAVTCSPNTIVLYRKDCYEYQCTTESDEETLFLMTSCLSPDHEITIEDISGETSWMTVAAGPPPPATAQHVNVMNTSTRLAGKWDSSWAYYCGVIGGCDIVVMTPQTRFDAMAYYEEDEVRMQPWQTNVKHQGLIEGVDLFDNKEFEISNAEAHGMDPVQRHVLETGAMSLAMEGLTKKICNRKSMHGGVSVGNDKLDWANCPKNVEIGAALGGTSINLTILANRFSFVYNLKGPSFVCDTACSASLTSTHCSRLCMYDPIDPLDFFLCFGAHLLLQGPFNNAAHMFSPDGRCFTFNASANGYLRGEGISGMFLKLDDPTDNRDAVLRSTQCGQDGRSASLTAPNGPAQEELMSRCMRDAKMLAPESTAWECHGTGTSLGDPIEVGAIRKIQIKLERTEPLMMTSAKSNQGHMEGNAAMGGMIRCVLQVKNGKTCPTLHFRTLNPHLEHTQFSAVFETEMAKFYYPQGHCQVSSFGFGGTNGHGIFWGRKRDALLTSEEAFMKKFNALPPAEVRPVGKNPDDWDADFVDIRDAKPGDVYNITISEDDPPTQGKKYVKVVNKPEEEDTYMCISGNFNDYTEDRMTDGSILGLSTFETAVPDGGKLTFHFLKDGDPDQCICPTTDTNKRTAPIRGPTSENKCHWTIEAEEGTFFQIEFFSKDGRQSVTWIKQQEG